METAVDTFPSLFWGYSVIWALIVLYVVSIGRRLSRLEKDKNQ